MHSTWPYRQGSPVDPGGRSAQAHLRAGTVFYALLIVHLSLYPYTGWRELGVGAWEYWLAPWIPPQQRFLTVDAAMNVLAYVPLGSLALMSLPQRIRRFAGASLLVWAGCSLMSASLEAVQTFLPSRVPSKMDLLCNSAGAALGVLLARSVLGFLERLREVITPSSPGLLQDAGWEYTLTMALWLFCLLSPLPLPYVMGPWLGDIWLFFGDLDQSDGVSASMEWLADWEGIAQAIASMAGLAGALCLGLAQTQPRNGRLTLFMPLMLLAIAGGWIAPQILPLMQGHPFHSPVQSWGDTGTLSVTAALLLALCLAMSDWTGRRLALLSILLLTLAMACTAVLPGYSQLALRPQPVPTQRTVEVLMAAADWLGAIWPVLGVMMAWRLARKPSPNAR